MSSLLFELGRRCLLLGTSAEQKLSLPAWEPTMTYPLGTHPVSLLLGGRGGGPVLALPPSLLGGPGFVWFFFFFFFLNSCFFMKFVFCLKRHETPIRVGVKTS